MPGLPTNPWAAVFVIAMTVLFGTGTGGAFIALRKDNRQADREEVDLTQLVKKVAADTILELTQRVESLQTELNTIRRQAADDLRSERERADQAIREERERSDLELQVMSSKLNRRIAQLEAAIRRLPGGQVPPWPGDTPPEGTPAQ
jgi:hypothetical protein